MNKTSLLCAFVGLFVVVLLTGCGSPPPGAAKQDMDKAKQKEKLKAPFDTFRVYAEPNERSFTDKKQKDAGRIIQAIKPGHWVNLLVETKANNFDFDGELTTAPLDGQQHPALLERNRFSVVMTRGVTLAKGQPKTLESIVYPPRSAHMSTIVSNRLDDRRRGEQSPAFPEVLSHMPDYQYFMIVLSKDANRYRGLKSLEAVRPLGENMPLNPEDAAYYRLVVPRSDQPLALPTQSLCWTSTAYVLWDDVLPSALAPAQQQAMLDWLHWGGGLILGGPQTLDSLRGSFLDGCLPATVEESFQLDAAALAPLNAHWSLSDAQGRLRELVPKTAWSGVRLARQADAEFLEGAGELVVERRVGRGRVVATAFRLSEPELWNWPGFDSFFNSGLLRRPRRAFDPTHNQFEFADGGDRLDPALVTAVRYFTRDARDPARSRPERGGVVFTQGNLDEARLAEQAQTAAQTSDPDLPSAHEPDETDLLKTRSGVAAWNDFSWISRTARETLREAAGIAVPGREFVAWTLGVYLAVVVPINWLLFRLLGRVEWAWVAVPVLATVGGAAVVWLTQLDIGFARAETEICVLEVQGDYPRGHVTRYTALYTALSTGYDVAFDEPPALALPFSADGAQQSVQAPLIARLEGVDRRELNDFQVSSNSTGMVHSEQYFDLGGSLTWSTPEGGLPRLENKTALRLSGVAILRRRLGEDDNIVDEKAWLGDVPAGVTVEVKFAANGAYVIAFERENSPLTRQERNPGRLSLRRILDCAEDIEALEPGDVRLVGWREGGLAGVHIEPTSPEARRACVVVAHLQYAKGPPPRPDLNMRSSAPQPIDPAAEINPPEPN
jgi:hypothetical protein